MTNKKRWEFIPGDEITIAPGRTVKRIRALVAIDGFGVSPGDLGGYVESETNLAQVSGNAWVSGNAQVYGNARVYGDAWVYGNAQVYGDARVYGNAWVSGDARVSGMNITAVRSDGYTFTVAPTPEGARIIAGCRYFTFDEARLHWTKTRVGTSLGDESLALVDHLERMAVIRGFLEPVSDPE